MLPASRHKSCYIYCRTDHAGTRSPAGPPAWAALNITASCVQKPVGPVTLTAPPGLALAGGRTKNRCSHSARQARPHPSRQPLHFATVIFDYARGKKERATATARGLAKQRPFRSGPAASALARTVRPVQYTNRPHNNGWAQPHNEMAVKT